MIIEKLHKAAIQYDGHVTNGSLPAQIEVVKEFLQGLKSELKTAADFGLFDDESKYPEQVAIEIMKKYAEKQGIEL